MAVARNAEDHKCDTCGIGCGFGVGLDKPKWYCRSHVPADFFAADRVKAAPATRSEPKPILSTAPAIEPRRHGQKSPAPPTPSNNGDLFS